MHRHNSSTCSKVRVLLGTRKGKHRMQACVYRTALGHNTLSLANGLPETRGQRPTHAVFALWNVLLYESCKASPSSPVGACCLGPGRGVLFGGGLVGELGARPQRGVERLAGVKALQVGGEDLSEQSPRGAGAAVSQPAYCMCWHGAAWLSCLPHQHLQRDAQHLDIQPDAGALTEPRNSD